MQSFICSGTVNDGSHSSSIMNRIIALGLPEVQKKFLSFDIHATIITSGDIRLKQSWS